MQIQYHFMQCRFRSLQERLCRIYKNIKLAKSLSKLNAYMLQMGKQCAGKESFAEQPKEIYPLLRDFVREADMWLGQNERGEGYEALLELYFHVLSFLRAAEMFDERYVTYVELQKKNVKLKLFCIDPSYLLEEAVKRGNGAIFFSAALAPLDYYREILGGSKEDYTISLPSPFDRDHLCLLIADKVSTKYKDRESSYGQVVDYIHAAVSRKKGNYLVFFPSYKYMHEVSGLFARRYPYMNMMLQLPNMSEEERERFLETFKPHPQETLVVFGVLGGIFSEGIDLEGERLSGAVIIGVGLPQVCLEREIILNYFQGKNGRGYEFAYMFPGMNKVLQASGRVIRSEEDRGMVLLVDERFGIRNYRAVFPAHWRPNVSVGAPSDVINHLRAFWTGQADEYAGEGEDG